MGGTLSGPEGVSAIAASADSDAQWGAWPAFELTDQTGRSVDRDDFLGAPLAVAAIFTTCAGPCPRITDNMVWLQEQLAESDVRLVSITVDPEYDSPAVLQNYAERHGADPERWSFLTGSEEACHELVRQGLQGAVQRAQGDVPVGQRVTHATRILAVDAEGVRRGWYDGTQLQEVRKLRDRLLYLAENP